MQFILLIIMFKLALTLLAVTLGAMFIAEFFPVLADKAAAAGSGTMFDMVGSAIASGLLFMAKYAQMFVDLVFSWLNAFGIDVDSSGVESSMRNIDIEAPKNIKKPEF